MDCVVNGIDARKLILENRHHTSVRSYPELIDVSRGSRSTSEIASAIYASSTSFRENTGSLGSWAMPNTHSLSTLATAAHHTGHNAASGEYEVLFMFLPRSSRQLPARERRVVPEKCDLNSILFLLTPAEDMAKLQQRSPCWPVRKNCWLMRR